MPGPGTLAGAGLGAGLGFFSGVVSGFFADTPGDAIQGGAIYGGIAGATGPAFQWLFGLGAGTGAGAATGYVESNGFRFTTFYWQRLWQTGRSAPGYRAESILRGATQRTADPRGYPGFYRYEYNGWYMIYNPTTRVVSHLVRI